MTTTRPVLARSARVGLLVLAGLVAFLATIITMGRQERLWDRKVEYVVHLSKINGLLDGSQVTMNGVPVGSVSRIAFPPDPAVHYLEVRIRITADVTNRVREDTIASVRTYGLLGDRYVELAPGTPDKPPIEAGGLIPSVDPLDYETVFGQSGDIVTNVGEIASSLKDVLQTIQRGDGLLGAMVRNREFGEQTLRDWQETLRNIRNTSSRLDDLLTHVQRGDGVLGHLVADTPASRTLVTRLDRSVTSLETLASGHGTIPRLLTDEAYAQALLGKLDRAVTDLGEVTRKLNTGTGTLGKLVNDDALYDDTTALVGEVRSSWLVSLYRALRGAWPSEPTRPTAAPGGTP